MLIKKSSKLLNKEIYKISPFNLILLEGFIKDNRIYNYKQNLMNMLKPS